MSRELRALLRVQRPSPSARSVDRRFPPSCRKWIHGVSPTPCDLRQVRDARKLMCKFVRRMCAVRPCCAAVPAPRFAPLRLAQTRRLPSRLLVLVLISILVLILILVVTNESTSPRPCHCPPCLCSAVSLPRHSCFSRCTRSSPARSVPKPPPAPSRAASLTPRPVPTLSECGSPSPARRWKRSPMPTGTIDSPACPRARRRCSRFAPACRRARRLSPSPRAASPSTRSTWPQPTP